MYQQIILLLWKFNIFLNVLSLIDIYCLSAYELTLYAIIEGRHIILCDQSSMLCLKTEHLYLLNVLIFLFSVHMFFSAVF